MAALIGAVLGATMGVGVMCAFAGWQGILCAAKAQTWLKRNSLHGNESQPLANSLPFRSTLAAGSFVTMFVLTGWFVAGMFIAIIAFGAPKLWTAKQQRTAEVERLTALASWVEMIRDTISAASGLNEAVGATALAAPAAIRPLVRRLVARAEREPLNDALAKFAQEANHAIADTIVLTLNKAAANQFGSLQQALSDLADNTRQEVSMRLKVEASRARQHASARFVMGVIAVFCASLFTFSRTYLEPFDSTAGQIALAIIGTLFVGSALALEKMSQFKTLPRILNLQKTNPPRQKWLPNITSESNTSIHPLHNKNLQQ